MRTMLIIGSAIIGVLASPAFAQSSVTSGGQGGTDYQGGAGSPRSTRASNITGSDTHSEIAPRLPSPDAAFSSPDALLRAAQQALNQGRTGAAQQALEMAETRALTRTVAPSVASTPDQGQMVQHISAARRALGQHDMTAAKSEIGMALNTPVPPVGPATTIR